jgi:hypothetical protein
LNQPQFVFCFVLMPVQQHPIPQNVTQFQFRLVGDMTLKQFLELAAGIVIGLVFYASPLPFFLKWPLIILFVALGASMAFLPVEGRPLEQWILAFFRSIYSPTVYTWQKSGTDPLTTTQTPPTPQPTPTPPAIPSSTATSTPSLPISVSVSEETTTLETPPKNYAPAPVYTHQPKPVFTAPTQPLQVEKHKFTPLVSKAPEQSTPVPLVNTPTPSPLTETSPTAFAQNLPIPHPPETPNTIVGMTLTPDGKIMESTIVEILKDGLTIRATKSNKLGQFLFVKPLDDGDYQLTAEKEGHTFPAFNLHLENKVIPPIQLKAQN